MKNWKSPEKKTKDSVKNEESTVKFFIFKKCFSKCCLWEGSWRLSIVVLHKICYTDSEFLGS
jgi:hypothetical protein